MTGHDETVVAVDLDAVLADEALRGMPDGPAKRFLAALAGEMRYGREVQIVVRRT